MIFTRERISGDVIETADVCVVGSGAGGAVAAGEAAEAGLEVVLLEEGPVVPQEARGGKIVNVLPILYRNNSFVVAIGIPPVPISIGCAVGGSTVINSGTCFRAPDEVLDGWGLEGLSPADLLPCFERVEKIISVAPGDEEVLGGNAAVLKRGAEVLGLSHGPIPRNARGCRGCGVCPTGCPENAKQSTEITYLPMAERSGARIYADCKATRVVVKNGAAAAVEGVLARRGAGEPANRIEVRAKSVVLACGAVYTPLLLMKSRLAEEAVQLGGNLRLHPGSRASALFDEDIEGWRGISQSYYVDEYRDEGIMHEATALPPGAQASGLPSFGIAQKEIMARFRNIANTGILISDSSRGRVRPGPGDAPIVTYRLNKEDHEKALRGVETISEIYFAAGAEKVFTPIAGIPVLESRDEIDRIRAGRVRKSEIGYISFHPMGTCRMGTDPRTSVVDPEFRVHGLRNLYVCDASVFPSSLGVNPQLTIMAFATRFAGYLADR